MNDQQRLDVAVHRLRGNPDYEQVLAALGEINDAVREELILGKDPNDVLRAQGGVRLMRLVLGVLAP